MSELTKLMGYGSAFVVFSVVTILSVAVMDGFSEAVRSPAQVSVTGITMHINTSVSLGTSYPFVQGVAGCINDTTADAMSSSYYSVDKGNANGGYIILNQAGMDAGWNNTPVNCSDMDYLADSDAQESADLFLLGLAVFGTFASIISLTLVGKQVVGMFKGNKTGKVE